MPTAGVTATPVRPGSTSANSVWRFPPPSPASSPCVVQRWPDGGTHWRSSEQILQAGGGFSVSG